MSAAASGISIEDVKALVAKATVPLLIDCFTPSCAPCAALSPILDSFSAHKQEGLAIEKVDVAANPAVARALNVRGVPTLLLYKDGALKATRTGATIQPQLLAWLSAHGVE